MWKFKKKRKKKLRRIVKRQGKDYELFVLDLKLMENKSEGSNKWIGLWI